jgi:hypothetical protein
MYHIFEPFLDKTKTLSCALKEFQKPLPRNKNIGPFVTKKQGMDLLRFFEHPHTGPPQKKN